MTSLQSSLCSLHCIIPHWKLRESLESEGRRDRERKRERVRQREAASGSVGGSTFHEFARWPFRLQIFVVVFRLLFPSFCLGARCCPCPVPTPRVEWQSVRSTRNSENETRRQTDGLSERVTTTGRIRNVALQLLAHSHLLLLLLRRRHDLRWIIRLLQSIARSIDLWPPRKSHGA